MSVYLWFFSLVITNIKVIFETLRATFYMGHVQKNVGSFPGNVNSTKFTTLQASNISFWTSWAQIISYIADYLWWLPRLLWMWYTFPPAHESQPCSFVTSIHWWRGWKLVVNVIYIPKCPWVPVCSFLTINSLVKRLEGCC